MKNKFASAVFAVSTLIALGGLPGFAAAAEGMDADMMGAHDMSGRIEAINHHTGWMKIKTGEGVLRIHYPPKTVKELKKGNKITVHLSYSMENGSAMNKGAMEDKMKKE